MPLESAGGGRHPVGRIEGRVDRPDACSTNDHGSSGVSGGYNLAFAATRFAASTWPRGPKTPAPCHNCMSHQELGLLWAIQPPRNTGRAL